MSLVSVLSRRTGIGTAQDDSPRGTRLTNRWNLLMVALPSAAILVLGFSRRWISDDGLIFVRTVRQILAGNGPVYNVGERAEASTSTVWQWVLVAAGGATGADVGRIAVYLGLLCTTAGYAVALDATRRLYKPHAEGRLLLPAGVLLMLALPPVWDFATSGLETGLSTLWTAVCWWLLVRAYTHPDARVEYPLAVLAGLGPMVRPDLAVGTLGFLVALWFVRRPRRRRVIGLLGAAAAIPVAYEVFRAGYYGVLLPLPAVAKEASGSDYGRGLDYAQDFLAPYFLWIPLLALAAMVVATIVLRTRAQGGWSGAVGGDAGRVAVFVMPLAVSLVLSLYVIRVGGDFMHARMLLPALFFMMLPILLVPSGRLALPVAAGVAVWAIVCGIVMRVPYTGLSPDGIIADERGFYVDATGVPHPTTGEAYLKHYPRFPAAVDAMEKNFSHVMLYPWYEKFLVTPLKPGDPAPYAASWLNLGMSGAAMPLDGRSIDLLGLASPLAAHLKLDGRGRPGHEKQLDIAWLIAMYAPDNAILPAGIDPVRVARAKYALTCGENNNGKIKELIDSSEAPMSWSRFWKNLSGSVGRTTYRVSNDPLAALQETCGIVDVPPGYTESVFSLEPLGPKGPAQP